MGYEPGEDVDSEDRPAQVQRVLVLGLLRHSSSSGGGCGGGADCFETTSSGGTGPGPGPGTRTGTGTRARVVELAKDDYLASLGEPLR